MAQVQKEGLATQNNLAQAASRHNRHKEKTENQMLAQTKVTNKAEIAAKEVIPVAQAT